MPNKTSAGLDNILNIVLKKLNNNEILIITIIFNNLINLLYFPEKWKTAKLICIKKKGDKSPHDPASYRPISLLSNLGKLFEKVLTEPIKKFSSVNKIIPDQQFGFRDKHSTVHAITKLTTDICTAISNGQKVGACLIDIEKCFDSVWTNGVIFKLKKKNFPEKLVMMTNCMIKNRNFYVSDGDILSSIKGEIKNGLQQGTIFSPILFNVSNSDVLNLFDLNNNNGTHAIAFADDLIVYVIDKKIEIINKKLEDLVNKINNFYPQWNLKVNPEKCEIILFRNIYNYLSLNDKKHLKKFRVTLNINGEEYPITHNKTVKYLGFHIDYLLRLNKHTDIQLLKAKKTFQSLSRLFYSKYLNKRSKVICYMLFVRPLITYATACWYNTSASAIEALRLFESKCLRICLNLNRNRLHQYQKYINNRTLYNSAKIPRIDNFIVKLTRNFFVSSKKITDNKIISKHSEALDEDKFLKCKTSGYVPPQAFINLDQNGYIQDHNNVPILYHNRRNKANKKILFDANDTTFIKANSIYSKAIPDIDFYNFSRLNIKKYWWLSDNSKYIAEIKLKYERYKRMRRNRNVIT